MIPALRPRACPDAIFVVRGGSLRSRRHQRNNRRLEFAVVRAAALARANDCREVVAFGCLLPDRPVVRFWRCPRLAASQYPIYRWSVLFLNSALIVIVVSSLTIGTYLPSPNADLITMPFASKPTMMSLPVNGSVPAP